jgi:hypothetical protein
MQWGRGSSGITWLPLSTGHCIMKVRHHVLAISSLFVVIGLAAPLSAQTIENPKTVEFDPSPDHDVVTEGTPLVDRYEMDFFIQGAVQPVLTLNLGKPVPAVDGRIRVNFVALLPQPLLPGTIYTALVAAVGPGGRAASIVAPDTFVFTVPCGFTVSPANPPALASGGGTGSVGVTTGNGCAWTASESAAWLTITSGASAIGTGTVTYTAAANTTNSPRSATLTVAGQSVTVTQDAAPCSFTVSPANLVLAAAGGSATISVTSTTGCGWTASQSAAWLSITSGSKGSGSGFVTISAAANTTTSNRTTTILVGGHSVVVTQPAGIPKAPTNVRIVGSGGEP